MTKSTPNMHYAHKYHATWDDIKAMMRKDFCKSQIRALISEGQLKVLPCEKNSIERILNKLKCDRDISKVDDREFA